MLFNILYIKYVAKVRNKSDIRKFSVNKVRIKREIVTKIKD